MIKTLYVGPFNYPITGQSVAFDAVVKNTEVADEVLYNAKGKSFLFFLSFCFKLIFMSKRNIKYVYFTSSRSRFGFFRDFLLIMVFYYKDVRIVNHLHGSDFNAFRKSLSSIERLILDVVYKRIDRSIVLADSMINTYSAYSDMEISVIPNFFSKDCLASFDVIEKKIQLSKGLRILFLSNLIEQKGILELIKAFNELVSEGHEIYLDVVGYSYDARFTELLQKSSSPKIIFHGVLTGKEKAKILGENHVLVLPTYYDTEAQPICIIEAMANACAIVTTTQGAIPELVDTRNALFVEQRSISSLKKALLKLVYDHELLEELMNNNYNYARKKFTVEQYLRDVDKAIRS